MLQEEKNQIFRAAKSWLSESERGASFCLLLWLAAPRIEKPFSRSGIAERLARRDTIVAAGDGSSASSLIALSRSSLSLVKR